MDAWDDEAQSSRPFGDFGEGIRELAQSEFRRELLEGPLLHECDPSHQFGPLFTGQFDLPLAEFKIRRSNSGGSAYAAARRKAVADERNATSRGDSKSAEATIWIRSPATLRVRSEYPRA